MPRSVICPKCQTTIPIPEGFSGRSIACPTCAERKAARRAQQVAAIKPPEPTPPEPQQPVDPDLDQCLEPQMLDDPELVESAEPSTYRLNQLSEPTPLPEPRRPRDGDQSGKKSGAKKKQRQRSIFHQESWVSTVVGFVLIGMVLSFGFWYVQRERDRPLREPGQQAANQPPPATTVTPPPPTTAATSTVPTPTVPVPAVTSTPTTTATPAPAAASSPASVKTAIVTATPATNPPNRKSGRSTVVASSPPVDHGMFRLHSTLRLPSLASDLVVGGAGQFMAVLCPDARRLEVVDLEQAQLAFTVAVEPDGTQIAAGRNKLYVFHSRNRQVIERWNLQTKQREAELPNPYVGSLGCVALGAASDGPLLARIMDRGPIPGWSFLDPESMIPSPIRAVSKSGNQFSTQDRLQVRAAANGSTFCAWLDDNNSSGLEVLKVNGDQVEVYHSGLDTGFVAPSFDGQFVTTGRGLFRQPFNFEAPAKEYPFSCFPALDNHFYLTSTRGDGWQLRAAGIEAILGDLPKFVVESHGPPLQRQANRRLYDRRLTFVSKTGRLVYLAQLNDALNFFDTDVKHLPSLATPRLIVTSRPPSSVKRGESFAYQIETIGLNSQLSYQLTLAPAGLTVGSTGKMTWDVPANFADSETTILLTVRSEQGAEDLQAIVLAVQ